MQIVTSGGIVRCATCGTNYIAPARTRAWCPACRVEATDASAVRTTSDAGPFPSVALTADTTTEP